MISQQEEIGSGLIESPEPQPTTVPATRAAIVAVAASQLGPQDPDRYWSVVCPALKGNPHKIAWCGGFALACLHQAGACDWPWRVGHGFVFDAHGAQRLPVTKDPMPGDIVYFDAPYQHYAIVREVSGDQLLTIDGNQGTAPEELVLARSRSLSRSPGVVFYSVAHLVAS